MNCVDFMEPIELNFLPLRSQDFTITIYRKKTEESGKKSDTGIRFKLKEDGSEQYILFDVSWEKRDGFNEYICDPRENRDLTKQYILRSLESKMKANSPVEFYSPSKTFYRELRFVMRKHKEGQTEVRIKPYFLATHLQFGFLIQHNFKVNREQPFNREVQKLSLSLDSRYHQNRSFFLFEFVFFSH